MNTIEKITENEVYKEVMQDSFGGVMYDIANQDKYDATELLKLWDSLTPSEQEFAGGIMKGAMQFLTKKDI